MKKFKDLISEITVKWFEPMAKIKFNEFSQNPQFEMLNNTMINLSKNEYNEELNQVLNQIKTLENYADIIGYVKMNKIDLTNELDVSKVQENILQGGLKSIPKILIKVQLGYISDISDAFFQEVRIWLDKIGRDTEISEINLEDINYLINLSLNKLVNELKNAFKTNPEKLNEIQDELNVLLDYNASLEVKKKNFLIVKIYIGKLRSSLFEQFKGDLLTQQPNLSESMTMQVRELEISNSLINEMEFVLDYADKINQELTSNLNDNKK